MQRPAVARARLLGDRERRRRILPAPHEGDGMIRVARGLRSRARVVLDQPAPRPCRSASPRGRGCTPRTAPSARPSRRARGRSNAHWLHSRSCVSAVGAPMNACRAAPNSGRGSNAASPSMSTSTSRSIARCARSRSAPRARHRARGRRRPGGAHVSRTAASQATSVRSLAARGAVARQVRRRSGGSATRSGMTAASAPRCARTVEQDERRAVAAFEQRGRDAGDSSRRSATGRPASSAAGSWMDGLGSRASAPTSLLERARRRAAASSAEPPTCVPRRGWFSPARSDELVLVRVRGRRRAGGHAELREDVAHVTVDGALAEDQLGRDRRFVCPAATRRSTSSSRGRQPVRGRPRGRRARRRGRGRAPPPARRTPAGGLELQGRRSSSPSAAAARPTSTRTRAASYGAPSSCHAGSRARSAVRRRRGVALGEVDRPAGLARHRAEHALAWRCANRLELASTRRAPPRRRRRRA